MLGEKTVDITYSWTLNTINKNHRMLSQAQLEAANQQLSNASPQQILEWAIDNLDGLYQTTAFGLTGTIAVDMISKLSKQRGVPHAVDLIFLDTLYHFEETTDLAKTVSEKYSAKLHNYIPNGVNNVNQFEALYGKELWKADEDMYDFAVKVGRSACLKYKLTKCRRSNQLVERMRNSALKPF